MVEVLACRINLLSWKLLGERNMIDRDDELLTQSVDTPESSEDFEKMMTKFERLVYLLGGLFENLSKKGDHFDTTVGQITYVVKQLEDLLKQYEKSEKQLTCKLIEAVAIASKKSTEVFVAQTADEVKKNVTVQAEQLIQQLQRTVDQAQKRFNEYHAQDKWSLIFSFLIPLAAGCMGGLIVLLFSK
jgi:hypothetical protein